METEAQNLGGYTEEGIAIQIPSTDVSLFGDDQYLFLLPPNGETGLSVDGIKIDIVYDIVTVDPSVGGHSVSSANCTLSLPAGSLVQGKAYNYLLSFDVTEVLADSHIVDWDDDNEDVNGGTAGGFNPSVNPNYDLNADGSQLEDLTTDNAGDEISGIVTGNDIDKITKWESTNPLVATVDASTGVVTIGSTAGTTTINGYINDEVVISYDITVSEPAVDPNAPEDLETTVVGNDLGDLFVGETADTKVTSTPEAVITWTSSNDDIATVDSDGIVTAVAGGKATIKGTTANGAEIEFTVEVWSKFLGYKTADLEVEVGETETLTFTAQFEAYEDPDYREPLTEDDSYTETNSRYVTLANEDFSADLTTYTVEVTGLAATTASQDIFVGVKAEGEKSGNTYDFKYSHITVVKAPGKFDYDNILAGNYLYSDGTTSWQSNESGKTCIGLIFHVDDDYALAVSPTAYTTTLTSSYWVNAAYANQSIGCSDQNNGYNNMANLVKYNNGYPKTIWEKAAVAALTDDSDPSKGHWYVPSKSELEKMADSGIHKTYGSEWYDEEWGNIQDYTNCSSSIYWSSTEKTATNVYMATSLNNSISDMQKDLNDVWPRRTWFAVVRF